MIGQIPETTQEMYDYLLNSVGVSEETLTVVSDINGWSEETMEDILYAVTGYRDFEQVTGEREPEKTYIVHWILGGNKRNEVDRVVCHSYEDYRRETLYEPLDIVDETAYETWFDAGDE